MFSILKTYQIWKHQGKQYIPDLRQAQVPTPFKGRPLLATTDPPTAQLLAEACPIGAITAEPFSLDLGKCVFCSECERICPKAVHFTHDCNLATNDRKALIITPTTEAISLNSKLIRKEIQSTFKNSLKLRQVSAGGDASNEWELNAVNNVNFDFGRYGIEFVASPRHADGLVLTGPITQNMAYALENCYRAIPEPKLLILVGTEAISGGIYTQSPAIERSFLKRYPVDLYVPGSPVHPLTFIKGIINLLNIK